MLKVAPNSAEPSVLTNIYRSLNPSLPEPFFVTRQPKGRTKPSVDFCCKESYSYDFGTGG